MKTLKTLFALALTIFSFIPIFSQSREDAPYSTGSLYVITDIFKSGDYDGPDRALHFSGTFVDGPSNFTDLVNVDNFKQDVMLSYGDYILAMDFDEDWDYSENPENPTLVDYGNITFTNWQNREYDKLCELQGVKTAPNAAFDLDIFFIKRCTRPFANNVVFKLHNIKTGEQKTFNSFNEDILRGTILFKTGLNPATGIVTGFTVYPNIMRKEMSAFFSPFLAILN